jgi:hypothetical protein
MVTLNVFNRPCNYLAHICMKCATTYNMIKFSTVHTPVSFLINLCEQPIQINTMNGNLFQKQVQKYFKTLVYSPKINLHYRIQFSVEEKDFNPREVKFVVNMSRLIT